MSEKFEKMIQVASIFSDQKKVPRGKVHSVICQTLGITLNNENVLLIKKALSALFDVKEVRIRGFEYYKFEKVKVDVV